MSRHQHVAVHTQQNPDATASASPGEKCSHLVHMIVRRSMTGRGHPGGRGRATLHLYAPGRKWAPEIAFLDSISSCGTTPLTSNIIDPTSIHTRERVVF